MAQRHNVLMMLAMFIVAIMLRFDGIHATSYTVGGAAGWSPGTDLQAWASQYTFYVGDTLCKSFSLIVLISNDVQFFSLNGSIIVERITWFLVFPRFSVYIWTK